MSVKFFYTVHVRLRIRQRDLSTRQIEATIASPDRVQPSFRGRILAQKQWNDQVLEVVYRRDHDAAVVMTAYWLDEEGD